MTPSRDCSALRLFSLILLLSLASSASDYYEHAFFDNSITSDYYFYSAASASAPSTIEETNGKLPVERKLSLTPPNSLRISWQSQTGGAWKAEVKLLDFRNRVPGLHGDTLSFWLYAPEAIAAGDRPAAVRTRCRIA